MDELSFRPAGHSAQVGLQTRVWDWEAWGCLGVGVPGSTWEHLGSRAGKLERGKRAGENLRKHSESGCKELESLEKQMACPSIPLTQGLPGPSGGEGAGPRPQTGAAAFVSHGGG